MIESKNSFRRNGKDVNGSLIMIEKLVYQHYVHCLIVTSWQRSKRTVLRRYSSQIVVFFYIIELLKVSCIGRCCQLNKCAGTLGGGGGGGGSPAFETSPK